jgi:hypothetical protein
MKKKLNLATVTCLTILVLGVIIMGWLIYCACTYDPDYGCKKLGYNKYISTFKACIDTDAKLHFVKNEDKIFSPNTFIPHYKPIYTELK